MVQTKNGSLRIAIPRCAHREDRGHEVDARSRRAQAALVIKPRAHRSVPGIASERAVGERGIGEPADGKRPAREETGIGQQAAKQRGPETQGIEPWEGHIPRPDHQGNKIIGHADRIGMPTKNTIVVPCMVNSSLNVSAESKSNRGLIN